MANREGEAQEVIVRGRSNQLIPCLQLTLSFAFVQVTGTFDNVSLRLLSVTTGWRGVGVVTAFRPPHDETDAIRKQTRRPCSVG